ncbi:hypothetical protein JCM10207_003191 [Rhodosporidiobolus poonsookiae]
MSLRIVSSQDVNDVTASVPAATFCAALGRTMASISGENASQNGVEPNQNPLRTTTVTELHNTLYMPARLTTSEGSATAVKIVAVPRPGCPFPGLPACTVIFDEATGKPHSMVNAAALTGIRTAATSALATTVLANPSSEVLVVFGTGMQATWHARLILQLFPSIKSVTFLDQVVDERVQGVLARMQGDFGGVSFEARALAESDEAVSKADIICTCVPSRAPLFSLESLKEGVHLNCIGSYTPSMFEFPPALVAPEPASPSAPHIPTILTDYASASLAEAGELISSKISPSSLIEIGTLIDLQTGKLKDDAQTKETVAQLRQKGRSLFKCVGVGGMDVAIADFVAKEAAKRGLGSVVDF